MSEKKKAEEGFLYNANYNAALLDERAWCKDQCHLCNQLRPSDTEKRYQIYHSLFKNVLRGLGLSNFYEDRLIDLLYHCNVKPVVNQIECHPFNQRQSLLQLMRKHQVVGMAWSPFTRDRQPIFDHPIIKSLAEKYGVSKHQIILRWHIQRGIIPLPKANNVSHMEANFDVFDFKLTNIDMDVMELLDQQDFLEDHHTAPGLERLLQLK